jgi:CRISPR system Cascade subunit CasA
MNLTTDAWIPALRPDGTCSLFSLQELFAEAHALRDLAVKPHERIALMRLLLCITQAALDGPDNEETWHQCRQKIQPSVKPYLDKWRASFELFGEGQRFLQVANLQAGKDSDEGNLVTKLDLCLATGNNATVFDNAAGENRIITSARTALNLLTFQCFSPSGRIGVARWDGRDTPGEGSSNHAPCSGSSMLHGYILGPSLLETLARNLLTKELISSTVAKGWGSPFWERPVRNLEDKIAIENATLTYLGRLVPYSRAVRLNETGATIILGNGLDYPTYPAYRESTATVISSKDKLQLLGASIDLAFWRQLQAVTVKRQSDSDSTSGPLALTLNQFNKDCVLWIGALVTDKAKILDSLEATYTVPPALFETFGRTAYEAGVGYADHTDTALFNAIRKYATALNIKNPGYNSARQHFWTRIEQSLNELFSVTRKLTPPDQLATSPWGQAIRAAAIESYERSCPRRTPRQIQAYSLGLGYLLKRCSPSKPAQKTKVKKSAA